MEALPLQRRPSSSSQVGEAGWGRGRGQWAPLGRGRWVVVVVVVVMDGLDLGYESRTYHRPVGAAAHERTRGVREAGEGRDGISGSAPGSESGGPVPLSLGPVRQHRIQTPYPHCGQPARIGRGDTAVGIADQRRRCGAFSSVLRIAIVPANGRNEQKRQHNMQTLRISFRAACCQPS